MSSRREFIKQSAAVGVMTATASRPVRSMGREKIKLAIVGTGEISHRYLTQAAQSTRARFVATCARTMESAKARAQEYGIGAWFDDYEAMYDAAKPDAVVVATPNSAHAAPTIAALERGIHVLCEKPMATTYEECLAMSAAAQKNGALFLCLPYHATPPFLAALEHLNEETLGAFTGAEAEFVLPGVPRPFWYDKKLTGGAVLDALVYPMSLLISLLGPASRVTAMVNTLIPRRILEGGQTVESDMDDNAILLIEWAGGQQASVRTLWGTSFLHLGAVIYARHGALWLSGSDVIIHSPRRPIPGAASLTWNGQESCYRIPFKPSPNEGLIEHFVDCIEGKSQPTCGWEQQLHVHEILFKGYEAARSGQAQTLQTTFTPWHRIDPEFLDTRSRFI